MFAQVDAHRLEAAFAWLADVWRAEGPPAVALHGLVRWISEIDREIATRSVTAGLRCREELGARFLANADRGNPFVVYLTCALADRSSGALEAALRRALAEVSDLPMSEPEANAVLRAWTTFSMVEPAALDLARRAIVLAIDPDTAALAASLLVQHLGPQRLAEELRRLPQGYRHMPSALRGAWRGRAVADVMPISRRETTNALWPLLVDDVRKHPGRYSSGPWNALGAEADQIQTLWDAGWNREEQAALGDLACGVSPELWRKLVTHAPPVLAARSNPLGNLDLLGVRLLTKALRRPEWLQLQLAILRPSRRRPGARDLVTEALDRGSPRGSSLSDLQIAALAFRDPGLVVERVQSLPPRRRASALGWLFTLPASSAHHVATIAASLAASVDPGTSALARESMVSYHERQRLFAAWIQSLVTHDGAASSDETDLFWYLRFVLIVREVWGYRLSVASLGTMTRGARRGCRLALSDERWAYVGASSEELRARA